MKTSAAVILCVAASLGIAHSREEAPASAEGLPRPEAHLMKVPTPTPAILETLEGLRAHMDFSDCDSMNMCNLSDAVPNQNGPKFSEMDSHDKLNVCSSLKDALDCSSRYTCQRLERLVVAGTRFFNVFCKKLLSEAGISVENCIREAHPKAIDRCQSHLNNMKAILDDVSPKQEAVLQACCEHRKYSECYTGEVASACSMDSSAVPQDAAQKVDRFCAPFGDSPCRDARHLKSSFDVPESISSAHPRLGFATSLPLLLLPLLLLSVLPAIFLETPLALV